MKKRRKEILFGLTVVLLCGLLVLFLGTRGKQRQGTGAKPRTVIEYTEEYEIFALYPHFGVAAADEELEAYVAAQCDAFRSDEHAGSGRSELHMEYRLYEPCLGVVSVEMTVFTRVAGMEATTSAAFCYAMPKGERLGPVSYTHLDVYKRQDLLQYVIDPAKCRGCTLCSRVCPAGAISGEVKTPHRIDPAKCVKCGACMEKCKFGAISKK